MPKLLVIVFVFVSSRDRKDPLGELLEELGFPENWDTRTTRKVIGVLTDARQQHEKARVLEDRVGEMESEVQAFGSRVTNLCLAIASEWNQFPPEEAVQLFLSRLEAAKQSSSDSSNFSGQLAEAQRRAERKESQKKVLESTLCELKQSAGIDSDEEFLRVGAIAEERREIEAVIAKSKREIEIIASGEDEEAFCRALDGADIDSIRESQRHAQEKLAETEAAYKKSVEEATTVRERLALLDRRSEAIEKASELENARAELRGLIERWGSLILAQSLLSEAIGRFEREHQPALLKDVESLFCKMTRERYVRVRRRLDESGTLVVEQEDGQSKEPTQLSRGTREQLYLAMRLAYIRRYCGENEPLPLVMDDVLVNFNDKRAKSTLTVLSEMSATAQIIFLTCHQSTAKLVLDNVPTAASIPLQSSAYSD